MAKRTPRSEAGDSAAPAPKARRARAKATADAPVSGGGAPSIETTEAARALPSDTRPPDDTIASDPNVLGAEQRNGEPTDDEIREHAYHLYLQRGGEHGQHEDDWHRAVRELRGRKK